jgi:hypothetical protein
MWIKMKKQNKKILLIAIIIIGLVGAMLFISGVWNKPTEVNCFPEGTFPNSFGMIATPPPLHTLCKNSTEINGYFYCNIDDVVYCPNGCKVTKIGDDRCIK